MDDYFEINNSILKLSEIKDCQVVEKEMVMRPVFRESTKMFGRRYLQEAAEPYGIIIDEIGNRAATSSQSPINMIESVVKDVMRPVNAIVDTVSDKFNVKTIKYKEYKIRLSSGRITRMFLQDIPAILITRDGIRKDVNNNTALQKEIGMNIEPSVENVNILQVMFRDKREDLLFYAMENKLLTIEEVGRNLKVALLTYQEEHKKLPGQTKPMLNLPHVELPKVELPKLAMPKVDISFRKNTGPKITIKPGDKS